MDLKAAQTYLGVEATGRMNSDTERAIKKWQMANGVTRTGVIGPYEERKMTELIEASTEADAKPAAKKSAARSR